MYWLLMLLLFSSSANMGEIDGSELMSSTVGKSVGRLRDDTLGMEISQQLGKRSIIRWSGGSNMSGNDISFAPNGSHRPVKRPSRAATDDSLCRGPDGHYLPIDLFALDTCARCYRYIPDHPSFFHRNNKWNHTMATVPSLLQSGSTTAILYNVTFLLHHGYNITVLADFSDIESKLRLSFTSMKAEEKWISCCKAAVECCDKMLGLSNLVDHQQGSTTFQNSSSASSCPPVWDGWTCWPKTNPNQVALAQCPHYIYFETESPACARYAEKACTVHGWYRRGDAGFASEKTNYNPCSPVTMLKQRTHVHVIAYIISTVALVPALLVFYSYKQLNVYRIRLHKNMFISILLNSILVIVFKVHAILPQLMSPPIKDSVVRQNALVCRLILITLKYLRMTNYMWMFCEGFYLHRLIAAAFAEQNSFVIFYLIGWVFPLLPSGIYAAVRALWYDDRCWIEPIESWEWVLNTPCLFSLVVNMIFLINIIRILVMKLRSAHTNEPSQYRKAVRATLVLVPLFGLHFIVTIYRPKGGCEWTEFYHYVNALLDGLQGCLVAIIFCYGNGEVHYLLKRSYRRFKERRRCASNAGNGRSRTQCGEVEGGGATGGVGCSIFIGRSNGSTTHFSMADCSHNPNQKQISMTVNPGVFGDRTSTAIDQADSTEQMLETSDIEIRPGIHRSNHLIELETLQSADDCRKGVGISALREPLIRETCLDDD